MSLAEELLADLEEEDDEDEDLEEDEVKKEEEENFVDEKHEEKPLPNLTKYDYITDVAKLTSSAQ